MDNNRTLSFDFLRSQIVGADATVTTPFGERLMVYADYTASGRCLTMIEQYIQNLQRIYANTHTEDDISGRSMSRLVEQAEHAIKQSVNAGPDGRIVCVGTGATGAIDKLQQIIGVALPPATRQSLTRMMEIALGPESHAAFSDYLLAHQPVVFVGPYEHHSNEISWRESLATVVEVRLDADGCIDLGHLETLLQDPAYQGRMRIGSFSAASNVTGMRTPVHEIAVMLHDHGAMACFDYAASAPYVKIDMNPPAEKYAGDASLDAVFISPHKFLGGPGASGVLVFNQRIYHAELPPSVSAGGTVDYVGPTSQDFIVDIEEREKAGTPGVLQILKAGLAFQVKDEIGVEAIEKREYELLLRTFSRWENNPNIEILGNPDAARRISIVSFNLKTHGGKYLHPKFVTSLLNDLFGIQSRAGCSCAGPYGHRLLDIDFETSEQYRKWIQKGFCGIKPGWCRISLHYTMDDLEADFIMDAIEFVAEHGHHFLTLYDFDMHTGAWLHKSDCGCMEGFSLQRALECRGYQSRTLSHGERSMLYSAFLDAASGMSRELAGQQQPKQHVAEAELESLKFFSVPQASVTELKECPETDTNPC
ncbi:MAG: aminotransferase class V-fold PLP-dependent enzyme [Xanthomonadales bacterium]|nr:aminotransferase class V-fold PLP-dependent enzyme [Gammaproteobacteria bacterium]MBT8052975.1 aminotransferase class V-fold PLP-dependent enzyme [Gammaproteobacteria bacterium]NND57867.1 aminotransferase class V-fold PLP-dependent enzyme [Xanthomonadales bacterium]NNK50747.1 aminotransferase class V-fold PLP-dependent enzyme [Xanthomonadales bacterium]